MKKLICIILALSFILSFCACDTEKVTEEAKSAVSKVSDKIKETVAEHQDDIAAIQDKAKESLSNLTDLVDDKTQEAKDFIENNAELKAKIEEASALLSEKFAATFVNVLKSLNIDTDNNVQIKESDDLSPEFISCMAHYEEFYDSYCAFYTDYAERNGKAVAADAAKALAKYAEAKKSLDDLEGHEFTTAEKKYLAEAQARVDKKLSETREAVKGATKK